MSSAPVVSVRVSSGERDLLQQAAEQARTSLSDFVRRSALDAAELALMERREIVIPAEDWDKFEAWAASPTQDSAALRELSATRPVWQD